MYRKILVGYDDSDEAKDALALGKQLADATGVGVAPRGTHEPREAGSTAEIAAAS